MIGLNPTVMMQVIENKRTVDLQYINLPNSKNLQALKDARKKIQQTARRCANEFWVELSQKIQLAANTSNSRGMYDGIKKAIGPVQKMSSSIKSSTGELLTDNNEQMEDWWNITQISILVRTLCLKTHLIL